MVFFKVNIFKQIKITCDDKHLLSFFHFYFPGTFSIAFSEQCKQNNHKLTKAKRPGFVLCRHTTISASQCRTPRSCCHPVLFRNTGRSYSLLGKPFPTTEAREKNLPDSRAGHAVPVRRLLQISSLVCSD